MFTFRSMYLSKLILRTYPLIHLDKMWSRFKVNLNIIILRYIDQGKNPQLYTKDCMEKSLAKNEAVKGKIDAFKVS